MLKMQNLNAGYGELHILKNVTLDVEEKEIVALIGPNGAGKSTVIKSLFGLSDIHSGRILFKGKDILHLKTHELIGVGIGYVNQGRIIFNSLTVLENIMIGADHITDDALIKKKLKRVYVKFPLLRERSSQLAFGLSGGQRQQLALGRALMQNPSLLLLDEPSLGLSPKLQKELFKTIAELKKEGIAVLIVEQNAKKAIEIADKTYLLEDGKIVLSGRKNILKHKQIKNVYLGGRY